MALIDTPIIYTPVCAYHIGAGQGEVDAHSSRSAQTSIDLSAQHSLVLNTRYRTGEHLDKSFALTETGFLSASFSPSRGWSTA